jgi:hypothetical protein
VGHADHDVSSSTSQTKTCANVRLLLSTWIDDHRTTRGKKEFDGEIESPAFTGSPELDVERIYEDGPVVITTGEGRAATVELLANSVSCSRLANDAPFPETGLIGSPYVGWGGPPIPLRHWLAGAARVLRAELGLLWWRPARSRPELRCATTHEPSQMPWWFSGPGSF